MHSHFPQSCWIEVKVFVHAADDQAFKKPPLWFELRYLHWPAQDAAPPAAARLARILSIEIPAIARWRKKEIVMNCRLRQVKPSEAKIFPDYAHPTDATQTNIDNR